MNTCCDLCSKTKDVKRNIYGEYLCPDCWDTYIDTPKGKAEYMIDICEGRISSDDLDSDFLCDVIMSWRVYFSFIKLTPEQKYNMEQFIKSQSEQMVDRW